jgi:hypothetical protein
LNFQLAAGKKRGYGRTFRALLARLPGGFCIEKASERMPRSTSRHVNGAATGKYAAHAARLPTRTSTG